MPSEVIKFLLSLLGIAGATVLLFPLVRALAERIRGRVDSGWREELQVLREDLLAEIQQARREIGDFGERVDFLERFIAKQREAERLPPLR